MIDNDPAKARSAAKKTYKGLLEKIKVDYGSSISKADAAPAMQSLVDAFTSGEGKRFRSGTHLMRRIAERNLKYNSRFSPPRTYVGKQGGGGYADKLIFGLFKMSFNGCEVIATFNALKYLGFKKDLREIANHYETSGAMLLGGFGVRPDAIVDYIEDITGCEVTSLAPDKNDKFDEAFAGRRCALMTFWNGPARWSIHTVMICHLKNGRIRIFNIYKDRLYSDFDSIEAFLNFGKDRPVPISLMIPEML